MNEKKKQAEFVVTDRRKFTEEGELRSDAVEREVASEPAKPKTEIANTKTSEKTSEPERATIEHQREAPPISELDQQAQHKDYAEGNRKLDEMLNSKTGESAQGFEMSFERLVASLYMTAMMQLGLMAPEGEQPRAEILGARQTIDTLGILNEKTKGNLTAAEQNLLQQSLFDLRMAYLEMTNAITKAPLSGAPTGGTFGGKK